MKNYMEAMNAKVNTVGQFSKENKLHTVSQNTEETDTDMKIKEMKSRTMKDEF